MVAARPSSHRRRHAVTLVEVLLVLCLLVALASLAWPALERPLANQKLRKAADGVRVVWGRARLKAMSTGETLAFRYSIESDRYSVQAYAGAEYVQETSSPETAETSGDYSSHPEFMLGNEPVLPEGVTFLSGETDAAADARAQPAVSEEAPSGGEGLGWSEPILFYPDGTTSTAKLLLKNEYDRCIELYLRGVTGVVTVGETYPADR